MEREIRTMKGIRIESGDGNQKDEDSKNINHAI